jgi:oligoendopeptidase F
MHTLRVTAALAALLAALPGAARERSEVPEKYTWKLSDMYPSDDAWRAARDDLKKRIPALAAHRGHLGDSAEALRKALDEAFALDFDLGKLRTYAASHADEDIRATGPRGMRQEAEQLTTELQTAVSFAKPELLAVGPEKVRAFLAADKKLAPYRVFLDDVLRWKPHTLSAGEERLIGEASALQRSGQSIYGVFKDADLPYPTVKFSTGEARLDPAAFQLYRASRLREDRDKAFEAFFGALKGFQGTFGAALDAQVRGHLFEKQARGFGSAMELALFRDAIPTSVYRQLLADVRKNLPTLHRYLKLRQRMLGLDQLRYQDLYVPLVDKVDMQFTPEQAMAATLEAVAPLGPEYVAALKKGFESRWTDFLPSTGKRPGAYSTDGVWGLHPFQLLNFNGQYEDLATLAHESGHSMHTWLAMQHQPYATFNYPIFVAEVASTLNENLLVDVMRSKAKDDATRLAILGNYVDSRRQTLFRQTLFAEFELAFHEMAERGEPITGEALTKLYLKITRDYYGHDLGVCRVDDIIGYEWSFVPHFYYDFYVYQYATSMVFSSSLAAAIRQDAAKGKTAARDRYLALLSAGGSDYPIELLKKAGVDPTTSAPFDAAMAEMNARMDEMEAILARMKK